MSQAPKQTMTQASTNANTYLRTKVMTATPAELRLMLLDGAIKFATQGRDGIVAKDYEAMFNGISQAREIIVELMTSIAPEAPADLADRVRSLYSWMFKALVDASFDKDADKATKVIEVLEYERETWDLFMKRLAGEPIDASSAPAPPPAAEGRPALSIQA